MGCDIHGNIEVKTANGWQTYRSLNIQRDYMLFSLLAGVRWEEGDPEPIAKGRGCPDDASELTKLELAHEGTDAHSITWLTMAEMDAVEKWCDKRYMTPHPARPWGYLFRNGWNADALILGTLDARVIIWFDN